MSNVPTWSTTAGSNNSSPPNGWPEGMARSSVNDCAREMMAALAKWYADHRGSLVTTGGTVAYVLTTNSTYTALTQLPIMAIRFNATNTTTSPTLNVDTLGATSIVKAGGVAVGVGEITTNRLYIVVYNSNNTRFEILNALATDSFASTTSMLFVQTSAPTGWTKSASNNNSALRLVTGTASTGGSTSFTSVFTSRTILEANLPIHDHGAGTFSVGTAISGESSFVTSLTIGTEGVPSTPNETNVINSITQNKGEAALTLTSGTVSGTSGTSGSGSAMNFDVQYVDVIRATKD